MEPRRRRPRSEAEWIDQREQAARQALQVSVAGLADDVGSILHLSPSTRSHPLLRDAVDRGSQILGSDTVLNAIETSVGLKAAALFSGTSLLRVLAAMSRRARS